ncbi:hypothetical protein niasHS_000826 [Heterodera schachtii]|uniref:BTB domain-containing protein n=1 Tax=Heterodera schachtii TaxID=97005 RepID=A0ABD2K7M5_HETSC
MLSTGEYADVHFLVGDEDEKEIIPAHKFILKLASDVFEAMFRFDAQNQNAENASTNCPLIEVPDVEAAAFKVMLSFIYAGDLSELNGDNAMAVLYAAKKYNIPALVAPSLQIPVSKLRNVLLAYAQARLFDMEDYANCCLAYIDKNADTLLKSEAFLQIEQKLLCQILARDELQIPENRRQMLGPALFTIRFRLLTKKEIWETIVPSGVLTADEVIGVEQYHNHANGINEDIPYTLTFPTHRRFWAFGTITMVSETIRFSDQISVFRGVSETFRFSDQISVFRGVSETFRFSDQSAIFGNVLNIPIFFSGQFSHFQNQGHRASHGNRTTPNGFGRGQSHLARGNERRIGPKAVNESGTIGRDGTMNKRRQERRTMAQVEIKETTTKLLNGGQI